MAYLTMPYNFTANVDVVAAATTNANNSAIVNALSDGATDIRVNTATISALNVLGSAAFGGSVVYSAGVQYASSVSYAGTATYAGAAVYNGSMQANSSVSFAQTATYSGAVNFVSATGINFGAQNLSTTGTLASGNLTVTGTASVSSTLTVTGVTLIAVGGETAPGLAFSSDTNTGIFRLAADIPAFATGGQGLFALFNDTTNPFGDSINDSLIYGGSSSFTEDARIRAVRITSGSGTTNGASLRLTGSLAASKARFIEFYQSTTLVAQCNASNAWSFGASGGTATHQVNGRARFEGTDSATSFGSVGTGNNVIIRNTNGSANTFAGLYFQDPSSTTYRGGIVGQYVSGAGAAVDLVFLNGSTENGRLSAAGLWTLGASGGTQTHAVNGGLTVSTRSAIGGGSVQTYSLLDLIASAAQNTMTSTSQYGAFAEFTANSSATTRVVGFGGNTTTDNSAFTAGVRAQFASFNRTKGAASTITRDIAYLLETPTQGTNNASIADNTSFTGNWFINSTSTNPSLFSGNVGIGGSPSTAYGLFTSITGLAATISSADTTGMGVSGSFASTATTGATGIYVAATTANSSFTCGRLVGLWIDNTAKGASSTITRRIGALIQPVSDGTNNANLVLGQDTINFTGSWNVYSDSTAPSRFGNGASFIVGSAALSTSATDGFLYIPTCAGTPTGVPTAQTGTVAMVFDTTNNRFYIYDGGWISVALA